MKATLTSSDLLPTARTGVVPGLHPTGVVALSQLSAIEPASSASVRSYAFDGATADVVAESAAKPASGMTITRVDALLVKLAVVETVSTEMQMDAPPPGG